MNIQTLSYSKLLLWGGVVLVVIAGVVYGFQKLSFFSIATKQQTPVGDLRAYSNLEDFQKQDPELYKRFTEQAKGSLNK